mmetsp:Transcript_58779/g.136758  ORF Transcript_58779/g.136758 Transcript_58779/m.136758 type:complete len:215 (-) Transcript_58779:112-756(-)
MLEVSGTSRSGNGGGGGSGNAPLCREMVVQQAGGVSLLIFGHLAAHQQEEYVDVVNADVPGKVILRIYLSESGKDSAVLLETAQRLPVALLDTGNAAGAKDKPLEGSRHVLILLPTAFLQSGADNPQAQYAIARVQSNTVVVARPKGQVLLLVHTIPGQSIMSVADANGSLVASMKPSRDRVGSHGAALVLHVAPAADAALVLAAIVCARKLSS